MSLSGKIRTLASYPPRRWGDLVVAAVMARRIERALAGGGVQRAADLARTSVVMDGKAAPVGRLDEAPITQREREKIETSWRLLKHGPFDETCLRRALVGGYFVRSVPAVLRIGVSKVEGTVSAHAWLEVGGVGLDPVGAGEYAMLQAPEGEK